ncbi:MAG TPA: integrase core domain-containing protein [Polyangiaceae bacterium]|nr:integrase core domain-containing protein [Polyangiaceae bacterium]
MNFGVEPSEMPAVIARWVSSLRTAARKLSARLSRVVFPELTSTVPGGLARDTIRSRRQLIAENAFLRQQLIVANRSVKRPSLRRHERGLLALLASIIPDWRDALLIVKPATLVRWHQQGFRLFWRAKSKPQCRQPRIGGDVVALIRRMATENRLWGAERIRGELLKLGIHVSKRTIQKHMRQARPPTHGDGQAWRTFLHNHSVWACDFLQTYDIGFRPVFAFFIVDVNTRRVVHVAATRAPTAIWTAQQLRNATTFDSELPQFIVRDNDAKFGADFDRAALGAGIRVIRTAIHAPLMNATCERFLGTVRRECLDHVIILGVRHFERVLQEYCAFLNNGRPHQALAQQIPARPARANSSEHKVIVSFPILGGLHHDYRAAA